MKNLIFLIVLLANIQLNCLAADSAAVRVSVTIPELPKTSENKDKTVVAGKQNEQLSNDMPAVKTEIRDGRQVVLETKVVR